MTRATSFDQAANSADLVEPDLGGAAMIDLEGVTSVADVGRVQALRRGSAPALAFAGRTTTFAEVDAMASRVANALIASGVQTQDRVAYLSKNTDHFLPYLLGACKARATLTPFNFRLAAPERSVPCRRTNEGAALH
jgi:acyl-CoA synthetase (AMP-forming)/AMP-acid ligase II